QLLSAAERGRRAWQKLALRLRSITPAMMVRFALVLFALAVIVWILARAWSVLLPFQVGAVLAYLLLPVVNRLARRMPRGVAILVVFGVSLLVFALAIAYLVPIIAAQLRSVINSVPTASEITQLFDRFNALLANQSPEAQEFARNAIARVVTTVRDNVFTYAQTALTVAVSTLLNVVNTLGFVLGFLIVPFWLYYVLNDEQRGKHAIVNLLPVWMRTDVIAVGRIVDRIFSGYLRGQVILGLMVGGTSFVGLNVLSWLGFEGIHSTALLGIFAGITELIPTIGPILGAIPAVAIGLTVSWETTLAIVVLYLLIQQVENAVLVPRITGETLNIHPAVLMIVLVAMSQFGLIWAILAAPLLALARDLFRYVYGRFDDPPHPAGELPPTPAEPEAAPSNRESKKREIPVTPVVKR
ncbi:MAG: hypothetical protein AVDCRST_MAG93-2307, partial [uncultured Chloroflexia bacterium]